MENKSKIRTYKKYKGKQKKQCYIVVDEGVTDDEYDTNDEGKIIFVSIKEDQPTREKISGKNTGFTHRIE